MRKLFTLFTLFCLSGLLSLNQAQTYTIYPTPQKVVEGDGSVELSKTINVICESTIGEVSRNRMKEVLERFNAEKISIPYTIRDVTLKGELKIKAANSSDS